MLGIKSVVYKWRSVATRAVLREEAELGTLEGLR